MKGIILIMLICGIILFSGCVQQASQQQPSTTVPQGNAISSATSTITIANFAFSPSTITVKVGDMVTWENNDSAPHTIAFDSFSSDSLAKGGKFQHKFDAKGTFPYHCSIHPSMKGEIIVE